MTPQESIDYLFSLQHSGIKFGLENTRLLLQAIGDPHLRYPSIHVAGTNGKGSTCAMVESMLRTAGYRTGLYTSPHLLRFSERIRVSGQEIADNDIIHWTQKLLPVIESLKCTFFEATTAIAMGHFAEQRVDMAILETGLGGRLDSTNVVTPAVSVITSIGYDHQDFLGTTLIEIASEKAGIIKDAVPVIVGPVPVEVESVICAIASEKQCETSLLNPANVQNYRETQRGGVFDLTLEGLSLRDIEVALHGRHQANNAAVAILAVLKQSVLGVDENHIRAGLADVSWPGRMQIIRRNPTICMDAAHNVSGMGALCDAINAHLRQKNGKVRLLMGLLRDKDCEQMVMQVAPVVDEIVTTTPNSARALHADELARLFAKLNYQARSISVPTLAFSEAIRGLDAADVLVVTGSHYLLSELLKS